jgi:alpha-amylase/alpha-mannosidase (GH57 family)
MRLAILWHFHQPIYRRPGSRDYVLPWVNFHATKNYHQMALLVEETGFPTTFNFVPCLLDQIEDYALGLANDPFQLALELPPDMLGPIEIERLRKFIPDETKPSILQAKALASFFSPAEPPPSGREAMLARRVEIIGGLIPRWRRLLEERRTELTVTPYYHPILPMLFNADAAGPERPGPAFRHPEDGRTHIVRGIERFAGVFGSAPGGMWPSEGAVSAEVARASAAAGIRFLVTDENVLWRSLGRPGEPGDLYRPYASAGLTVFFRDRVLSDLVGFTYQHWDVREAVADLVRRIEDRRPYAGDDAIIVLTLDGENPWATYPENGVPFLREMFTRLASTPGIEPVFFGDYLAEHPADREIALVPGTWLGNFSKWSGSPEKNNGWARLAKARAVCGPIEEILIAEGSDWFWWLGEEDTREFDFLFGSYLQAAYHKAGIVHE